MDPSDSLAHPRRRALRLRHYDYAQAGAYFVTLCAHQRRPLFGRIDENTLQRTPLGTIAAVEWLRTISTLPGVSGDEWVLMPNHLHAIVYIDGPSPGRRGTGLATIVGQFKAATTRRARQQIDREIEVWQRGYYEHIVRDQRDLDSIREYIADNPVRWAEDVENPNRRP
jgi:REP element-mobilizing transposase RayT